MSTNTPRILNNPFETTPVLLPNSDNSSSDQPANLSIPDISADSEHSVSTHDDIARLTVDEHLQQNNNTVSDQFANLLCLANTAAQLHKINSSDNLTNSNSCANITDTLSKLLRPAKTKWLGPAARIWRPGDKQPEPLLNTEFAGRGKPKRINSEGTIPN